MCFEFACSVVNSDNIATGIMGVVVGILGTAVSQSVSDIVQNSVCIIRIVEFCISTGFIHKLSVKISICVFHTVHGFSCTNTTAVIAIAYACITICECCKLSAVFPCHWHSVTVCKRIADFIVGYGLTVIWCENISPIWIVIFIRIACCTVWIGNGFRYKVTACIISIVINFTVQLVIYANKLIHHIVTTMIL